MKLQLLLILLSYIFLSCSSEEKRQPIVSEDIRQPIVEAVPVAPSITSCSFKLLDGECSYYNDNSVLCSMGKCNSGDCTNGKGVIAYPNGTTIETSFKMGKMGGVMSLKECSKGMQFLGTLSGNSSKGKHTYPNGEIFEGSIVDGVKQGKGIFTDSKGNIYVGNWKDDIKEGKFTIKDLETKAERVVTYINGKDDEQRERERLSAIEYKRKEQAELAQTLRWQSMVNSCNILSSGNYNHCDLSVPTIYNYSKTAYITTCISRKNIKVEDVYFQCQLKGQKLGAIINNLARIYFDQNGNCSTEIGDLCD